MFTDINIYPINNKTYHISEKYIFYRKKSKTKVDIFSDFRSDLEQDPDPEPDSLFHETDPGIRIQTDPGIRIHIKMKRIRNTDLKN